jgi:hypothetical protein
MKEKFIDRNFSASSMAIIEKVNAILTEYTGQGFRLSLRQLYYQLVARGYIENTLRSYKRTGDLVSNARLAGLIDWQMIEDRNRDVIYSNPWNDPGEIVQAAASQFHLDHWEGQPCYVEVMVEKDALSGILEPVCESLNIRFMANKGYSSSSAMYEAARRIYRMAVTHRKEVHIFYLGDHDPSGIDMTRDIQERLEIFTKGDVGIELSRLALNWGQIEEWKPPKNPAKETDSRFQAYVDQFGESSWELDAVEPRELSRLVNAAVTRLIDQEAWDKVLTKEERMKADLLKMAEGYEYSDDDQG